jgi:hypothetical protein
LFKKARIFNEVIVPVTTVQIPQLNNSNSSANSITSTGSINLSGNMNHNMTILCFHYNDYNN